jgi:hypothetical protein
VQGYENENNSANTSARHDSNVLMQSRIVGFYSGARFSVWMGFAGMAARRSTAEKFASSKF